MFKVYVHNMLHMAQNINYIFYSYLSLHGPFHSASLPHGFRSLSSGILPVVFGVVMSTYVTLVILYAWPLTNPCGVSISVTLGSAYINLTLL